MYLVLVFPVQVFGSKSPAVSNVGFIDSANIPINSKFDGNLALEVSAMTELQRLSLFSEAGKEISWSGVVLYFSSNVSRNLLDVSMTYSCT